MRWISSILLIGVFARHNLTWLPGYSPQEWFYILGGMWEIILCLVLLSFITNPMAISGLWIGILEAGQVSLCGALMGHQRPPEGIPECDFLTGLPIGATMTGLYLIIICWAIGKEWRERV